MSENKLVFSTLDWTQVSSHARFKAFERNGKTIRIAEFSSDFIENDWCEKSHIGFVLEGELEIDFDSEQITFKQGDGIFIPPDSPHKAKHLTEKVVLFLVEEN